ncbi:hypothetical protein RCL1_003535 [Eukaryota sp. TZLM3-RCL]
MQPLSIQTLEPGSIVSNDHTVHQEIASLKAMLTKTCSHVQSLQNIVTSQSINLSNLQSSYTDQIFEISLLESKIKDQGLEMSLLRSSFAEQSSVISKQADLIHDLQLNLDNLNQTKVVPLLQDDESIQDHDEQNESISHINSTSCENDRLSTIEHQLNELKQSKAEEVDIIRRDENHRKRLLDLEYKQSLHINPLEFIIKNRQISWRLCGGVVKFIPQGKGTNLKLTKDDCFATSVHEGFQDSFVPINHPLVGRITLTLKAANRLGKFMASIGFFDITKCYMSYSDGHFVGFRTRLGACHFKEKGSFKRVCTGMEVKQSVVIDFDRTKVTYSLPHEGWTCSLVYDEKMVFGISIFYNKEAWAVRFCCFSCNNLCLLLVFGSPVYTLHGKCIETYTLITNITLQHKHGHLHSLFPRWLPYCCLVSKLVSFCICYTVLPQYSIHWA